MRNTREGFVALRSNETRILSGIIYCLYWRLYIEALALGGGLFIALAGVSEFYRGFKQIDIHPSRWIGWISAAALYGLAIFGMGSHVCLFAVVALSLYLFKIEERQLADGMATILGVFMWCFSLFTWYSSTKRAWDTCSGWWCSQPSERISWPISQATFSSKALPKISPKTIEGAIGHCRQRDFMYAFRVSII